MRTTLPLTLALFGALTLGCGQQPPGSAEATTARTASEGSGRSTVAAEPVTLVFNEAGAPTVEFDVPGMHCEVMCVPKVRETLKTQPGVVDVKVDLGTKTATVAIEESEFDSAATLDALAAADFPEATVRVDPAEALTPVDEAASEAAAEGADPVEAAG